MDFDKDYAFSDGSDFEDVSRYGNENVDEFLKANQNENTQRKTTNDMKILLDFLHKKKKMGEINLIDLEPGTLNRLLADFFINNRQKNGEEYQPSSLRSQFASINRFLQKQGYDTKYSTSVMTSDMFKDTREALKLKMSSLKAEGKGNLPNRCKPFTDSEIDLLHDKRIFSVDDGPGPIANLVFFNNCLHFGIRPGNESRNIKLCDFEMKEDESGQYIEYNERRTKTRTGATRNIRKTQPRMHSTSGIPGDPRDPVEVYKVYMSKRPHSMFQKDSPFYLSIKQGAKKEDDVWFAAMPMGKNKLATLMKCASEEAGITGKKIGNHSVRKTLVRSLKRNKIPDSDIQLVTGHKNIGSITDYSELDQEKTLEISHALSGYNPSPVSVSNAVEKPTPDAQPSAANLGSGVFVNSTLHGKIIVNIYGNNSKE